MDVNLPKFLAHDIPLFEGIISDLFPGIELPKADYTEFLGAVHAICEKRNIQPVKFFEEKVVQMYEMMIVRHGYETTCLVSVCDKLCCGVGGLDGPTGRLV